MSKLDECFMELMLRVKLLIYGFLYDEEGDVNIVSMVVLIGIAVLLAVVFRNQIQSLLTTLFNTITKNATKAIGE